MFFAKVKIYEFSELPLELQEQMHQKFAESYSYKYELGEQNILLEHLYMVFRKVKLTLHYSYGSDWGNISFIEESLPEDFNSEAFSNIFENNMPKNLDCIYENLYERIFIDKFNEDKNIKISMSYLNEILEDILFFFYNQLSKYTDFENYEEYVADLLFFEDGMEVTIDYEEVG